MNDICYLIASKSTGMAMIAEDIGKWAKTVSLMVCEAGLSFL